MFEINKKNKPFHRRGEVVAGRPVQAGDGHEAAAIYSRWRRRLFAGVGQVGLRQARPDGWPPDWGW